MEAQVRGDALRKKSGWAGLTPEQLSEEDKREYQERMLADAESFRQVFCTGLGPQVLAHLERFVYGLPLIEESHPNMDKIALVRGGMRETVEYIQKQIFIAQQGEFHG